MRMMKKGKEQQDDFQTTRQICVFQIVYKNKAKDNVVNRLLHCFRIKNEAK